MSRGSPGGHSAAEENLERGRGAGEPPSSPVIRGSLSPPGQARPFPRHHPPSSLCGPCRAPSRPAPGTTSGRTYPARTCPAFLHRTRATPPATGQKEEAYGGLPSHRERRAVRGRGAGRGAGCGALPAPEGRGQLAPRGGAAAGGARARRGSGGNGDMAAAAAAA